MYMSQSVQNKPVAVTGVVAVPNGTPPAGGFPVVTWGHGTNGMADVCAPSLSPASAVPLANDLLDQGWVVTASDYQGEGTPGLMPYLAGVSAARNTIDIVRAARQMPGRAREQPLRGVGSLRRRPDRDVRAAHRRRRTRRRSQLEGVVAGAPPSQFGAASTRSSRTARSATTC